MQSLFHSQILAAVVVADVMLAAAAEPPECPCPDEYKAFRVTHNRGEHNETRCHAFCRNLALINDHNARKDSTYLAAIRPYHDLPEPERLARVGVPCYKAGGRDRAADEPYAGQADLGVTEVDWRMQDHETPIRNQAQCGDCWAESATALVEAVYAMDYGNFNHGDITHLSVQQLAECTPQFLNKGCGGGWPIDALRYIANRSSVCTEAGYPTVIGDGLDRNCNQTLVDACSRAVNLGKVTAIPKGNETGLYTAAQRGLVSVAIDASGSGFGAFASGVYNGVFNGTADCNGNYLDHAVVVTGMAVYRTSGVPFYIVRNSWDTTFGMDGYLFMQRGINTCGIANDAVHVSL